MTNKKHRRQTLVTRPMPATCYLAKKKHSNRSIKHGIFFLVYTGKYSNIPYIFTTVPHCLQGHAAVEGLFLRQEPPPPHPPPPPPPPPRVWHAILFITKFPNSSATQTRTACLPIENRKWSTRQGSFEGTVSLCTTVCRLTVVYGQLPPLSYIHIDSPILTSLRLPSS
jgi:hypothetical protein